MTNQLITHRLLIDYQLMLPCNRDCWASPASRANTFSSLNFASEQVEQNANDSPEDRYFSFNILNTLEVYETIKLRKTEKDTPK